MAVTDREYATLLSHLRRSQSSLPLSTVQVSIAHYLAHLAPSPTPFVATVLGSPFFQQLSYNRLQTLTAAFRYAARLKCNVTHPPKRSPFFPDIKTHLELWVTAVLEGVQGRGPILRLACCGGVLLGLDDLKEHRDFTRRDIRKNLEGELVVALAEIVDTYGQEASSKAWENEFQPRDASREDPLSLALILASQSTPLISSELLKTLPLHVLVGFLLHVINSVFRNGAFLSLLPRSNAPTTTNQFHIPAGSPFIEVIQSVASSPSMSAMGPLAKLYSRTHSLLLDIDPTRGIVAFGESLRVMNSLIKQVESDWVVSPLSSITNEIDIAPDTLEITKTIWTVLKTLLFCTVMITQDVLSAMIFVHPQRVTNSLSSAKFPTHAPSSASLVLLALDTLFHLSFVISKFGGLTASHGGFSELKKTFYLSLDIVAADSESSEAFVRELFASFGEDDTRTDQRLDHSHPVCQSNRAFALACMEQLVPAVTEECVEIYILPLCMPHLSDATHREIFESSHSVVLAVLATLSQRVGGKGMDRPTVDRKSLFVPKLVAFYTACLIENSADGKLSTVQLRYAFSTLVRAAGATSVGEAQSCTEEQDRLVWFSIHSLLAAIRPLSGRKECEEHLHRLHLTLISTVSSLSLSLVPRVLNEIRNVIVQQAESTDFSVDRSLGGKQQELVEALFEEISERTANSEKDFVLKWWLDNRRHFETT